MLDIMSEISIPNKDLFNEARLKRLMKEEGLAAVIGMSPANVTYMSGYHNLDMLILPEILSAVIWPLEGEPTFMVYDNKNPLRRSSRTYGGSRVTLRGTPLFGPLWTF